MTGLTKEQKIILKEVGNDKSLSSGFYFSGGTALSAVYLHHRVSEDLDFFTEQPFDQLFILNKINHWAKKYALEISPQVIENIFIYNLMFPNGVTLKTDFCYYPYKRLKESQEINGVKVDSLEDIAINKLVVVSQRTEVKDFVDLYFLLKQFTVWNLLEGSRKKFGIKFDLLNLAADFLKIEDFEFLPKMSIPLELGELKNFYKNLAKKLGLEVVEK